MCGEAAARLSMLPDIATITLAEVSVEEGGRLGAGASGEVSRGEKKVRVQSPAIALELRCGAVQAASLWVVNVRSVGCGNVTGG